MTDAAAFAGTYSDLKLVKSRSVAQVIVELPIEHAERFIAAFGMPIPGSEKPVALALLNPPTAKPGPETAPAGGSKTEGERAVTRAALLCRDPRFQAWCGHPGDEAGARFTLLETCDIASRSLLATNADALAAFKQMETDYLIYSGRMAEMRS